MATIKFKDLIEGELQNKIRSVKDLVDYVGKPSEQTSHPNYSIFLGAGASVASGIKTGGNLVDQWRREIYEKECGEYFAGIDEIDEVKKEEIAKQIAIDYLIKEHGVWYNPQNEYSSLFERKFDLPIQRRRFVENIVDGHLPSIGYLFLITLINKNYFNTIFTTNFDDLINEAFYQFSNTRPLLCAHDSAVSSISVVSKRPKIIKLHGDYLFDDIKNTIKETESLEQNIKQKFIEFTKDNGLIVVGYSGQDRSILDVVNYLLQQEDYLKNGLYWCFRAEDEISHEVRKILWKDKVYCVQIDGFDELFTEFCSVAGVKPNLIDNPSESKRDSCIDKFVRDYNSSKFKNKWIADFIEEVSTARNNQDISDLIRQFNENKTQNLSADQLKGLLLIETLIKKNSYKDALDLVDDKIKDEEDEDLLENYYKLKVRIYKLQNKKEKAFKLIDSLIEKDEFNVNYYLWKLMFLMDTRDKIQYLCSVHEKINYMVSIKNIIVQMFVSNYEDYDGDFPIGWECCEKLINESLNIDSSVDNDAYSLKLDFLKIKKRIFQNDKIVKDKEDKIKKVEDEFSELIENIGNVNKHSSQYIRVKKNYVLYKKDLFLVKEFFAEAESIKSKLSKEKSREVINNIAYLCNQIVLYSKDEIKSVKNWDLLNTLEIDDFFMSYGSTDLKCKNPIFMLEFSKYLMSKKQNYNLLRDILDSVLNISDSLSYIKRICTCFLMIDDQKIIDRLKSFIDFNKGRLSPSDYLFSMALIERARNEYITSLSFFEKYYKSMDMDGDDYISLIYSYLLAQAYDKLEKFLTSESLIIEGLSKKDKVVITINSLAAKKLKYKSLDNIDKTKLQTIISKYSDDKRVLICANSLLDNNSEALHHIKEMVVSSYIFYYELMEWPAINQKLKQDTEKFFRGIASAAVNIAVA